MIGRWRMQVCVASWAVVAGCTVMDTNLAMQQVREGGASAQQGINTLRTLSAAGYEDARLAMAQWQAGQGDRAALLQVKNWLLADWQRQPANSRAQLRYLRWLVPVTATVPEWTTEAQRLLLARQQQQGDVFPLLARLYALHPQQLEVASLRGAFDALDLDNYEGADSWLQAQLRLPALVDRQDPARLKQACGQVAGQLAGNGHCYAATLAGLRWRKAALDDWQHQTIEAIKAHQLDEQGVAGLMDDLMSSQPNGPQLVLARLLGDQMPDAQEVAIRRYTLMLPAEGPEDETLAMEQHLQKLAQGGDARASMLLGRLYLHSPRRPTETAKAMAYFAAAKGNAEAAFWLGQIYLSGRLGDATAQHVQHGIDLLVSAARGGYPKADAELAETFALGKGVKPNPQYAWVFASLAMERSDSVKMHNLLDGLKATGQQPASVALLRAEQAQRGTGVKVELPALVSNQTTVAALRADEEK